MAAGSPVRNLGLRLFVSALACLAAAGAGADDDFLRCGSKLVSTGVDAKEVLAQCGEPTQRTSEEVPIHARRANGTTFVNGTVTVEHWTYDRGSSRFPARLKFENGKLVSIEFLRP